MAAVKDNFADIDFEEITEATALEVDEIKVLKLCFNLFDVKKQDFLGADDLDDILRAMGFRPSKEELKEILEEIDEDGSGEIEFGEFCQVCNLFHFFPCSLNFASEWKILKHFFFVKKFPGQRLPIANSF